MFTQPTVSEAFARIVEAMPSSTAITDLSEINGDLTVTYAELSARVDRTEASLLRLGVEPGDTIATLLPNCLQWVDVFLAAARLGALLVPLNTRYRAQELRHLLALSGARILLTAADFEGVNFSERVSEVLSLDPEHPLALEHIVSVAGDPAAFGSRTSVHQAAEMLTATETVTSVRADPDAPLIVFGTSGTTSAPKLALHTSRSTMPHMRAVAGRLELRPGVSQLTVLSLSGTFGFVPFLAGLLSGCRITLLPIFKIDRVAEALRRTSANVIVAAEGSMRELLEHLPPEDFDSVELLVTAGLSIEDIVSRAEAIGVVAMNVYGSSEVFAFAATSSPQADRADRCLAGGRVVQPNMEVRVADPETERVLEIGEVGELQFRGRPVFREYLKNAEATRKSRTSDGWFRTGDSARLRSRDEFEYLARANDTLRLGGYSVSPADVEDAIGKLATVRQAQVVGVRDERSGDDLGVAFVIAVPGAELSEADILDHCRHELASFKVPKRVVIVTSYPTAPSANGDKVKRDQLRVNATALLLQDPPRQKVLS